jgi:hypothetical protein
MAERLAPLPAGGLASIPIPGQTYD